MNKRLLALLSLIFFVLLVVAFQPIWQPLILNQPNNDSQNFIATLPDEVDALTIIQSDSLEIKLKKNGSDWLVNDLYKVDKDKLDSFLTSIKSIKLDNLVSSNPNNFATYGASDSAARLRIEGGSINQEIIVGLPGPQAEMIYLRPVGKDAVYLAQGSIREPLFYPVNDWRDKTLVNVTKDQILKITITRDRQMVTLSPNEQGVWSAVTGGKTRQIGDTALVSLTNALSPLQGEAMATEEDVKLFNRRNRVVTVELYTKAKSEPDKLQLVEDTKQSVWLVKLNEDQDIYRVTASNVSGIVDNIFALFK